MNILHARLPLRLKLAVTLISCLWLLAACARGNSRVDELCAQAEAASAKDDFVATLDAYGEALKIEPTNSKALLGRATSYVKFHVDTDMVDSKYKGQTCGYDAAIDDLTVYLKLHPEDADALVLRAQYRQGYPGVHLDYEADLKQELEDLDRAIRLRPKKVEAYLIRADFCQMHVDMSEESESEIKIRDLAGLNQGITLMPDSWQLYSARANCYRLRNDQESNAILDYTKAIELALASHQPTDEVITFIVKRSDQYFRIGKTDLAVADDKKALELAKAAKQTPQAIAGLYRTFGQRYQYQARELALACYDQTLLLEPDDQETLANRGECHLKLKHYEAAIADFTKANNSRALAEAQHEFNLTKGILSFDEWFAKAEAEKDETKRPEMYAKATDVALAEAKPDYLKLSDQLIEKRQYDLAPALLNLALKADPESKPVQARLHVCAAQRLWWKEKNSGQALNEIEAARQLDGSVAKIVASLEGICHQDQFDHGILTPYELLSRAGTAASNGDFEKAVADSSKGLALEPTDDSTHFLLLRDRARYYRHLKEPEIGKAADDETASLPVLNNLIEANPKDASWRRLRGELYASFHEAEAWELAGAEYKKALELNPASDSIKVDLYNLGQECLVLAQNTNDDALAEKLAKVAEKIVDTDADTRLLIDKAELFLKVKNFDGAVAVVDRLLARGKLDSRDKSSANAVKCRALMHLKDFDGVLAAFKEVDPASDVYVDVRDLPGKIKRLRTPAVAAGPREHQDLCANCSGMGWITENSGHYDNKFTIVHEKLSEHTMRTTTSYGPVWVPEPHKLKTCPECNGSGLVTVVR